MLTRSVCKRSSEEMLSVMSMASEDMWQICLSLKPTKVKVIYTVSKLLIQCCTNADKRIGLILGRAITGIQGFV